jgi:hypothetical protein
MKLGDKTPVQELWLPQQREDTTGNFYPVLMSLNIGFEKHVSGQAWIGVLSTGYDISY